jgi:hypothetical protein
LRRRGFDTASRTAKSKDFGVVSEQPASAAGKSNGREGAGK